MWLTAMVLADIQLMHMNMCIFRAIPEKIETCFQEVINDIEYIYIYNVSISRFPTFEQLCWGHYTYRLIRLLSRLVMGPKLHNFKQFFYV